MVLSCVYLKTSAAITLSKIIYFLSNINEREYVENFAKQCYGQFNLRKHGFGI